MMTGGRRGCNASCKACRSREAAGVSLRSPAAPLHSGNRCDGETFQADLDVSLRGHESFSPTDSVLADMSRTIFLLLGVLRGVSVSAEPRGDPGSCSLAFQPAGSCAGGDGGECPYRITLPPLTIQLPGQFHLLERTLKEVQDLKEELNKLRRSCLEYQPQADQHHHKGPSLSPGPQIPTTNLQEMQAKITWMSNSVMDTRTKIDDLQGRLEHLDLVDLKNVETMVDNKVADISVQLKQLSSKCAGPCPNKPEPLMASPPVDCSDYSVRGVRNSGVYRVRPDPLAPPFDVFCNMESHGGGWTVLQRRLNGSVSFNRTWSRYKLGFGDLRGEFWIGNDHLHLLTKAKDMTLRIELQDLNGLRRHAKYKLFYVANEFLKYRLSVDGYSGTAGDALHYSKSYNHDQKFFSTPDQDNDMYEAGSCGTYYGSGWWFDACMSANLNGKYYKKRYRGVRDGIFWSTWHNSTSDFYPTNYRQVFKTIEMMIRPKSYAP
ncbi:fibroleukin-like [Arapaima gigas]